jgi:hypothetical protein
MVDVSFGLRYDLRPRPGIKYLISNNKTWCHKRVLRCYKRGKEESAQTTRFKLNLAFFRNVKASTSNEKTSYGAI